MLGQVLHRASFHSMSPSSVLVDDAGALLVPSNDATAAASDADCSAAEACGGAGGGRQRLGNRAITVDAGCLITVVELGGHGDGVLPDKLNRRGDRTPESRNVSV